MIKKKQSLQIFEHLLGFIAFESPEANYEFSSLDSSQCGQAGCGSLPSPRSCRSPESGGAGEARAQAAHARELGPGPAFPGRSLCPQRCDTFSDWRGQTL